MTDEERREAERLANQIGDDSDLYYSDRCNFLDGYEAACEAKRAEIDDLKSAFDEERNLRFIEAEKFMKIADAERARGTQLKIAVDKADDIIKNERARSAKLIAALHRLTSRETMTVPLSPNHPSTMVWEELTARVKFACDTLAEYEASRE